MRGKNVAHRLLLVTGLAAVLLVAGCVGTGQSPPSRFYILSSIESADTAAKTSSAFDGMGIGIGPVRLPAYLQRQQIVVRTSPNEIRLAEFDRWAEPLEHNFIHVLKENLSILLDTAIVVEPPLPKEANIEFQVVAGVSRFDAEPGRQVVLSVRWAVVRIKDERLLMVRKSTYSAPVHSAGIEEIVKAQSMTVADFSRDIAAAVQDLYRREHGQ